MRWILTAYTSGDPAAILITNSSGQSTGYEPRTGALVHEIPHSISSTEQLGDDTEMGFDGEPILYAELHDSRAGRYDVSIVGVTSGPYSATIRAIDSKLNVEQIILTGVIEAGELQRFPLCYAPGTTSLTLCEFCPADLNGDEVVNSGDIALLLQAWGPNPSHPADFNHDGVVNSFDLNQLLQSWGAALCEFCPADLNDDEVVNSGDIALLLQAWGPNAGHPADLNDDGVVNSSDIYQLLQAWGPCPQ